MGRPVHFPARLALANLPTPLQPLRRLSAELGGPTIWLKRDDLTGSAVSGNKVRKLEFSLAEAQDLGCDTVLTVGGVQSNHCRATALLCAQLGLNCHLLLFGPETPPDGNLFLDRLAGAKIDFYPAETYSEMKVPVLEEWSNHYRDAGARPFTIPSGASNATGLWGYIGAARELAADFERLEIAPGHILFATGSGGTQGGLVLGRELFGLEAAIQGVIVDEDRRYFENKIRADMRDWSARYQPGFDTGGLDINLIEGYVGAGYAIASAEVFELIRKVARTEGVVLDPVYTGKAFLAMVEGVRNGAFGDTSDIVFIHTGGIFGLIAQREQVFDAG